MTQTTPTPSVAEPTTDQLLAQIVAAMTTQNKQMVALLELVGDLNDRFEELAEKYQNLSLEDPPYDPDRE